MKKQPHRPAANANANGGQFENNGYSVDGISTVSAVWGGSTVITPSEDSVSDIKIVTNAYDAENGRFSGAMTEITSKSGTNQLHGSLFAQINRPGLDAYQRWNGPASAVAFDPTTGQFAIQLSTGTTSVRSFPGFLPGDLPVPADYQGIGRTDLALYRPSTGQSLIQLNSGAIATYQFGTPTQGDIPVPADYDGSGRIDLAVFRSATDQWRTRAV